MYGHAYHFLNQELGMKEYWVRGVPHLESSHFVGGITSVCTATFILQGPIITIVSEDATFHIFIGGRLFLTMDSDFVLFSKHA